METKIEYALSRPVRNEENIDKRRGALSDHKEPKAVIAVIRYPNGDFDLRVNRLAKLDENSSFVNKYMGMIIPYYGWAKKKEKRTRFGEKFKLYRIAKKCMAKSIDFSIRCFRTRRV